jgi:signal transduction histidine kinase
MSLRRATSATPFHPLRLFFLVLVSVFTVEASVMALLPALLPPDGDKRVEALVDSCLLTLVLAPILWRLVLAPLRRLAETRARLLRQIISAQEEERRRIARDLHDEIGQALTTLLVGLRTLEGAPTLESAQERARELRGIGGEALGEVRRLARGLRPSVLDDLGLVAALERYTADYTQAHGIAVHVHAPAFPSGRLPGVVETALYRIVQEALTNTAKHAKATAVWLDIELRPGAVRVTLEDDGCGFASDALLQQADGSHLGLSGMFERAALLNGSVSVASKVGRGTRVCVTVPLTQEKP